MKTSPILLAIATLALLGCSGDSDNSLFCDESTPCANGVETFCDIDKAFPGTGLKNECIAPPSATACNRVEACTDSSLHCSDESMGAIGECVPCVDASHCPGVGEVCNMTTNECEALPCTVDAAGDDICFAAAPAKPYCVEADTCGECRPEMDDCAGNAANAQVCDAENFACRGCQTNNECTLSDLCDTVSTECAAETDLLYVVATGGSDTGTCTRAAPCATIQKAIDVAMGARNTILVGAGTYSEPLDIDNKTVNIIGQGMVIVNPTLGSDERALVVRASATATVVGLAITPRGLVNDNFDGIECNNSTLSLDRVTVKDADDIGILAENNCTLTLTQSTVEGNTGIGISSTGGTLTLTQSTVEGNTGIGISSTGGTLTLTQSTVSGNDGGGVKVDDSNYSMVNNFFTKNGNGGSTVSGVRVEGTNDKSEEFSFNTVAENQRGGTSGFGLFCDVSNLNASNNIFMLRDLSSQGLINGCITSYSLVDSDSTGNTGTETDNLSANAIFVDPTNDDFRLQTTPVASPGIDAADPTATLNIDIDGNARPGNGRSDMGAHEAN